ncbi:MAG TPA: GNAT family N-acyltransferase [Terriglobales bacterium]|nr:GNAT family N-acyltransferase [Terriglobales bacterium]
MARQKQAVGGPNRLVRRLLFPRGLQKLYRRLQQRPGEPIFQALLREMNVAYQVAPADLQRIPTSGPVVAVANHPFGFLEGAILCDLALTVRPDVRVLTNYLLAEVPELQRYCIALDPFQGKRVAPMNRRGVKEAMAWLAGGGMLLIFPAGEVASWHMRQRRVTDPQWSSTASRLIRNSGATALPTFIDGGNSIPFHLLGLVHPRLRTVRLPHELLNKRGRTVKVHIASPIPHAEIAKLHSAEEATCYLRWRTYLLHQRDALRPHRVRLPLFPRPRPLRPIAAPPAAGAVRAEVRNLPPAQHLIEDRDFRVFVAAADQIPNLLTAIGRAREITFRQVGEGTGEATDLDEFDRHYQHLILWHRSKDELAGAYRIGRIDQILARWGSKGLYTNTLFRYRPEVFDRIGPALELGRSFILAEYQKHYGSLLCLWKGIARYVAIHPEAPVLMGAVSISSRYNRASRELIVRFFEADNRRDDLSRFVQPRLPFRGLHLREWDLPLICRALEDVEALSDTISDIEADGKGLPILLRQYVKVGGRLLGFNVDRNFSDVLDGLVMVDLRQTDPKILERYMGSEGLKTFRAYHRLP